MNLVSKPDRLLDVRNMMYDLALFLTIAPCVFGAFKQEHFVIGGQGPVPSNESYATLRAAGISFIHASGNWDSWGHESIPKAQEMASLCVLHNLSCVLPWSSFKVVPNGPGVWGYFIRDEPLVRDFPGLAADVARVRKLRPDALSFLNLLGWSPYGNYGNKALYGTDNYTDYVDLFLSTVKPDIIIFDLYPSNTTTWMYHMNLAIIRNKSLEAGLPFWNYVWLNCNGGGRGQGFYRWELFTAAAYGSKGLLQWCISPCSDSAREYCGPKQRWVPYPTLLDTKGHAFPPVFEIARAEHQAWTALGPLLLQMESRDVVRIVAKHSIPTVITGMPLRSMSCFHGCHWTIGHFQFRNHSKRESLRSSMNIAENEGCVMVVNDDPIVMLFGTLDFGPGGPDAVREVSQTTGEFLHLVDGAPDVFGFQLFFLEGQGRLFCWINSTVVI